jgi:hypothetical protein
VFSFREGLRADQKMKYGGSSDEDEEDESDSSESDDMSNGSD